MKRTDAGMQPIAVAVIEVKRDTLLADPASKIA